MDILDKIIADKRREVALKKEVVPVSYLEQSFLFNRQTSSLKAQLKGKKAGIIAEHKRRSPSRSVINQGLSIQDVARGYAEAGAAGISILTDGKYFGGSLEDLQLARAMVSTPLLRKEFIIDEYQLLEAKANGADVILLIAAVLDTPDIRKLSVFAKSLGLEVLLEVHNKGELQRSLMPSLDLLGVNNRNLKTFEVSLETSKKLAPLIPGDFIKVSESGISSPAAVTELCQAGFSGFLVGELFMKSEDPAQSACDFINAIEK
jgi:indole-3-glycerol phosphate synthase